MLFDKGLDRASTRGRSATLRSSGTTTTEAADPDEDEEDEQASERNNVGGRQHKFENIGFHAYKNVLREYPEIVLDKEEDDLSKAALTDKGLSNYLDAIEPDMLQCRAMYGFAKKRSSGKIKYFQQRWMFLISSRPLNFREYLTDGRILDETQIPPLLELDTLYFYIMGKEGDSSGQSGELKTYELIDVKIKDMSKSNEEGHALSVDAGHSKYHLNFRFRFELEKWREALFCSMQTAREAKLSITGMSKNISKLVHSFYMCPVSARYDVHEKFRAALQGQVKFREIDTLIEVCQQLQEDMMVTFDACMAQSPQRRDIIAVYMEEGHELMMKVVHRFWEKHAISMGTYETLSLIDWVHNYILELRNFGITDVYL